MITVNNRWQAFGIHLLISAIIFLILFLIIVLSWYPGVFIHFGGIEGLKIVAGVDLVLGPLLTLIVFNKAKKSLKWDLTAIGVFQFVCLSIGVYFVYQERPVAQVLAHDGVYVISASEVKNYQLEDEFSKLKSDISPKWVYLDLPEEQNMWGAIIFSTEFTLGHPVHFRTDLYKPMSQVSSEQFNSRVQLGSSPLENTNCANSKIVSKHAINTACVTKKYGITKLFN